ncbi:MAG: sigma-54 dependent transcriptional regulator [Acidobacteriota bacterium]
MTAASRILIADDQRDVLESLRFLLKTEGFLVETVTSPRLLLEAFKKREFDAVLMDLNYARDTTSGQEGLDLLQQLRELDDTLPVVVMTAWASIELAVEAMRRGARDFVEKPWDNQRLLTILRTQVELGRALRQSRRLAAENQILRGTRTELIAGAPAMKPVLALIERVGPSDANVLITGENGTGKNLVARLLHEVSPRAEAAMITVNLPGLAESVFESELFGHVRGAFTDARDDRIGRFEAADGGTLFLDEIANLPINLQPKLLRVLESGELERVGSSKTSRVDVRLVSATNADLDAEVAAGHFRQDLLFRLNTVEIRLPPLRDRREDLAALADTFLREHAKRYRKSLRGFSSEAMKTLLAHRWPGNVRELAHVVERAVLMADGEQVRPHDLGLSANTTDNDFGAFEQMTLDEVERLLIERALGRHDGNVTDAARALGVSRSALYRRLEKFGL